MSNVRIALQAVVLTVLASCSGASGPELVLSAKLSSTTMAFGEVPSGSRLLRTVTVTNDGDYPFWIESQTIGNIVGPAVFRVADVEKPTDGTLRKSITKGRSVTIPVTLEVGASSGAATAQLLITYNPGASVPQPPLVVDITATVVDSLMCGSCETQPPDRCLTSTELLRYSPAAACADAQCGYRQRVVTCPAGCDFLKLACNPLACKKEPPVVVTATSASEGGAAPANVASFAVDSEKWDFLATWVDKSASNGGIRSHLVLPTGLTDAAVPLAVDAGQSNVLEPTTAFGSDPSQGNMLAFVGDANGDPEIFAIRYGAGLPSQPAAVRVTTAPGKASAPALAAGNGKRAEFGLAWVDARASAPGVYFTRVSATTGEKLADEVEVTGAGARKIVSGPALIWSGSSWLVVWSDERDGAGGELYSRRLNTAGAPIGPAVRLTDGEGASVGPSLVPSDAGFYLSWLDSRSGTPAIMGRKLSASGEPDGEEELVFAPGVGKVTAARTSIVGKQQAFAWLLDSSDTKEAGVWVMLRAPGLEVPSTRRVAAAEDATGLAIVPTFDQFGLFWAAKQPGRTGNDLMFQRICNEAETP